MPIVDVEVTRPFAPIERSWPFERPVNHVEPLLVKLEVDALVKSVVDAMIMVSRSQSAVVVLWFATPAYVLGVNGHDAFPVLLVRQVPLIEKHPALRLIPCANVEVAVPV